MGNFSKNESSGEQRKILFRGLEYSNCMFCFQRIRGRFKVRRYGSVAVKASVLIYLKMIYE